MITSELLSELPGILHGFGTSQKKQADFVLAEFQKHPRWQQNHGISLKNVIFPGQECGEVDALYCEQVGIPISVITADCVPILMAHQDGSKVLAVHAGWRGTKNRILRKIWKDLLSQGESPEDWVAAIGPCIGPCCFEVSEELVHEFCSLWKSIDVNVLVPQFRHLNLACIHKWELQDLGVKKIDTIQKCTFCTKDASGYLFESYRREARKLRQWSSIMKLH